MYANCKSDESFKFKIRVAMFVGGGVGHLWNLRVHLRFKFRAVKLGKGLAKWPATNATSDHAYAHTGCRSITGHPTGDSDSAKLVFAYDYPNTNTRR